MWHSSTKRIGADNQFEEQEVREVYAESICDDAILALKWKDKRNVSLLSIFRDDSEIKRYRAGLVRDSTETVRKPALVGNFLPYDESGSDQC